MILHKSLKNDSCSDVKKDTKVSINYPLKINDVELFNKYDSLYNNKVCKIYNSGVILITNNINTHDIFVWCYYHLNIIKFDKIILIDNTADGLHKKLSNIFNGKIDYYHRTGVLQQNLIYNEFVNNTNIKWLLPIDDDEYLYISNKYKNDINVYLASELANNVCDKYAFKWHIMFSPEIIMKRKFNETVIELFRYVFVNTANKQYDENNVRYAFPFVKTIVNTELKHLYLNDNGVKNEYPVEKFYNNSYPEEKTTFAKNIYYDFLGSVHNPITYKNNEFIFAYNRETEQYYNGMYSEFTFNKDADAYLYHFKYRTTYEYEYKCQNFNFSNILTSHIVDKYNLDSFYTVNSLIKNDIYRDDNIFKLFKKHKNKIESIYNSNYNSKYYYQNIYENEPVNYDAIIALTSWKNRIHTVYDTIMSIKKHNKYNYLYVLTLSTDEFPNQEDDLPEKLLSLPDLKILWVKYNYKSFKKYLFTMQTYTQLPIITADDGCIYIDKTFDRLFDAWQKNKSNIYCYVYWPNYFTDDKIKLYSINSGTGVIFPPNCFDENSLKVLENNKEFMLSTNEDDFFTSCLIKMYNKKIIRLNNYNMDISKIYYEIDEPVENKISNNIIFKEPTLLWQTKLSIIEECFKTIFKHK